MKSIRSFGLAVALCTVAVVGFSGCAGTRYEQSTGEQIDDAGINHRVKAALEDDSVYKYPDVSVVTFKGTVQLSGFVNLKVQKERAGELAKKAVGTEEVVNNITVKE